MTNDHNNRVASTNDADESQEWDYFKSRLLELRSGTEGSEKCPHGRGLCRCGTCAICGRPRHDRVHAAALRKPARQWHHAYEGQE